MTLIPAHHRFNLQGRHGQLAFGMQATLAAPWTVLFGPSGSGKTTLLNALAGLRTGLALSFERRDPCSGSWFPLEELPPEDRKLALDPQQALLLPHLSAADNVRLPEVLRGLPLRASALPELAALLALEPLLAKRPHQLSGGERQRIALARALAVPDACLLLLDEPFTGLDRRLRDELLPRLRTYLSGRALPVLSVTHDVDEVLLLEADVLRIDNGHIVAQGEAGLVLAPEIARLSTILQRQTATTAPALP